MRLLAITAALLALGSSTSASSVSVTCAPGGNDNVTMIARPEPYRRCNLRVDVADGDSPVPACNKQEIKDLSKCNSSLVVEQNVVWVRRNYTDECWDKLCTNLDGYFACVRESVTQEIIKDVDYKAAAYQLLSDCSLKGFVVDVEVGSLKAPTKDSQACV